MVADGYEEAVYPDIKNLASLAHEAGSGDARCVAEDLLRLAVPEHLDVGSGANTLLHGLGGPEHVAADYHIDLGAEAGEIGGLLAGGIASAHHGDVLAAVEESVAGRTGGNAESAELLLGRKAEVAGGGAGGDDDRVGGDRLLFVDDEAEGTYAEVSRGHGAPADVRAEKGSLLAHPRHQVVGVHSPGETGIVLHQRGGGQLAARLVALIEDGVQACAGGIDRGGIARGASAYDKKSCVFCFHILQI